jgi:hypothetical protein
MDLKSTTGAAGICLNGDMTERRRNDVIIGMEKREKGQII